jgi:hypothetical protein
MVSNDNLTAPLLKYNYDITLNLNTFTYTVTLLTPLKCGIVGSFNDWGSNRDADLIMNETSPGSNIFTYDLYSGFTGEFKFRFGGAWNFNYGSSTKWGSGSVSRDGGNLTAPTLLSTYTITLNLNTLTYTVSPANVIVSGTCFPAGTPVTTNQGNIAIEQLNPEVHTIRNKKIVGITQTVTLDKSIVCFEKDSLGENIPSQRTVISNNHCIFYKGHMIPAKVFVGKINNVTKIKYTGEILYNVLMEEHDKMVVNNLICETLNPENRIAKIYKVLEKMDVEEYKEFIVIINKKYAKHYHKHYAKIHQ